MSVIQFFCSESSRDREYSGGANSPLDEELPWMRQGARRPESFGHRNQYPGPAHESMPRRNELVGRRSLAPGQVDALPMARRSELYGQRAVPIRLRSEPMGGLRPELMRNRMESSADALRQRGDVMGHMGDPMGRRIDQRGRRPGQMGREADYFATRPTTPTCSLNFV